MSVVVRIRFRLPIKKALVFFTSAFIFILFVAAGTTNFKEWSKFFHHKFCFAVEVIITTQISPSLPPEIYPHCHDTFCTTIIDIYRILSEPHTTKVACFSACYLQRLSIYRYDAKFRRKEPKFLNPH